MKQNIIHMIFMIVKIALGLGGIFYKDHTYKVLI